MWIIGFAVHTGAMSRYVHPPRSRLRPDSVPPHLWFGVSAVFHYLGPSFAVLLFPAVGVLGVAWFRIASAALIFAPVTRPWRVIRRAGMAERWLLLSLGAVLAVMNTAFYLALDRLPIALVAAIEFVGTLALAAMGANSLRNWGALLLSLAGVALLIGIGPAVAGAHKAMADPLGLAWACLNGALFVLYVALGHRAARTGAAGGIERLGAAMFIAALLIFPVGLGQAVAAFGMPVLVLAGLGVGLCSSVIPYVCDQFAMARLPRASFALLLSLLPATAALIGVIVLRQVPGPAEVAGIALVMAAVALHRPAPI